MWRGCCGCRRWFGSWICFRAEAWLSVSLVDKLVLALLHRNFCTTKSTNHSSCVDGGFYVFANVFGRGSNRKVDQRRSGEWDLVLRGDQDAGSERFQLPDQRLLRIRLPNTILVQRIHNDEHTFDASYLLLEDGLHPLSYRLVIQRMIRPTQRPQSSVDNRPSGLDCRTTWFESILAKLSGVIEVLEMDSLNRNETTDEGYDALRSSIIVALGDCPVNTRRGWSG